MFSDKDAQFVLREAKKEGIRLLGIDGFFSETPQ